MKQKKLLIIGPESPPFSGMEVAMDALLAELLRQGIPFTRVDTADPADVLENRGRWTLHNVALAIRHVLRVGRRSLSKDVTAVYLPIAQDFPALLRDIVFVSTAQAAGKPVIVHLHGGYFGEFFAASRPVVQRLLKATIGRAHLGIVLSERLRPALECVIPCDRVVVVENGLDLPGTPSVRSSDGSQMRVLFLSSLLPGKGAIPFLEGFARAWRARPFLRATLAGASPSPTVEREVLDLMSGLGIESVVSFIGSVEGSRKAAILEQADVFCFPSTYYLEGQPLVVIEAMAAGLPVVATRWRSIPDLVVDGETGFLLTEPSPNEIAEKLIYFADHPGERERLGAAGRDRYERFYTQRAFGERMINVLLPLLQSSDSLTQIATNEEPSR